jgi:hypothetical protein
MAHYDEIDYTKRQLYTLRFKNELTFLNDTNYGNITEDGENWMSERMAQLEKILENIEKEPMEKPNEKYSKTIFDEVEKYIYKKPWKKLQPFHRMKKIEEYLNDEIKDEKDRKMLIEKFRKLVSEGKLNSDKLVEYDPTNEKIISLSVMTYDENEKSYKIEV